jgi:hypothetical protein
VLVKMSVKNALLNALVVGVVLVGLLWAYEYFVMQPRELRQSAQLQDQVQAAAQESVARFLNEEQGVAVELEAAVAQSIAQVREGGATEARLMAQRAQVVEGLTRASSYKVALAELYATTGQWPANGDEAGLPASQSPVSDVVSAITLGSAGTLEIAYATDFGSAAMIKLIPSVDPQHGHFNWRCVASGFSDPSLVPLVCR